MIDDWSERRRVVELRDREFSVCWLDCHACRYLNILPNVTVRGDGAGTLFVSETGGKHGNHVLVYLKDGAAIEDLRLSGSDYISRLSKDGTGGAAIAHNKIGVTTQGAVAGRDFRVSRVGFSKMLNSHVYVDTNHSGVLIDECYTFGARLVVSQHATQACLASMGAESSRVTLSHSRHASVILLLRILRRLTGGCFCCQSQPAFR